jgi:glycosyltransferase involved in cell wall biosynthesis
VVFLACRQPDEPDREIIAGVEVRKLPVPQRRCTTMREYAVDYALFFLLVFLHLLVRPRRYRLIHVNNMPDVLVFATLLPRLLGRPVIHDVHDLMPELFLEKFTTGDRHWAIRALKAQERWAGRFATAVLTVEERLRDILASRGIDRGKIHVLLNLPDDRIFTPRPTMPAKSAGAPLVMVYHGTLARRLGLDLAIEAVARVRQAIPEVTLRIIGAGEERETLIALRDRLGLQDVVSFSDGFVPVETIPALLTDADIGLVPLRISSGTDIMLPTKLLEYVLLGIPCIVPCTGTIARYFDAEMVQFFEAENIESLAAAIVALHADPAKRRRLAMEATQRFTQVYQWRRHKQTYTDLVTRLLGEHGMT